jgi:dolichol-phosphate mannosyltransferase
MSPVTTERVPQAATASAPGAETPVASVIVPTFREAPNIEELVTSAGAALRGHGIPHEIIIVDDNSKDGIDDVVAKLASTEPVRLFVREDERGLASAVVRGFREARGDVLVCMDADLSHPPDRLPELIEPIKDGDADFTIGSRYVDGGSLDESWSFWRRLNSRFATALARPLTHVGDPLAGFFALRRERFEQAGAIDTVGYKICLELIVKTRPQRCVEVPIHFQDRQRGESKLTLGTQLEYLGHLGKLYTHRFLRRSSAAPRT